MVGAAGGPQSDCPSASVRQRASRTRLSASGLHCLAAFATPGEQSASTMEDQATETPLQDKILGYLSWAMLAASTVGPGSVIVCSKAGADFKLNLIWCLIIACCVAYILLEAAARMVIVSGHTFGQAMRKKYGVDGQTPLVCWAAAWGVLIGNSAYQANNFAGGMGAVYIWHENETGFRWGFVIAWASLLTLFLLKGDSSTSLNVLRIF